ncbi:MAG TPA: polyprenyl synthetase family protein, partial [Thermoflexales bacterium]|nr:polyprenyl synthetase family protein [Thermoflexales bacterium]
MPQTLADYFKQWIPRVESEMLRVIESQPHQPAPFTTMLAYHLGFANEDGVRERAHAASGKRIRPLLTLLACEACGGQAEHALPAAAAVELLHNFSLIHDDIEDRDELRRGRPTLWAIWGDAQAINAGDAMFALAHLAMEELTDRGVPAERALRALRAFDAMCVELTIGQHLDLGFENQVNVSAEDYMQMIEGKTAALVRASCALGGIIAGASEKQIAALGEFGLQIGLSFQLQDDVLGIWGDPSVTGKADSDLKHHKKTLPAIYAAERNSLFRSQYFRPQSSARVRSELMVSEVNFLRGLIEQTDARPFTEAAAETAYARAMEAFEDAGLNNAASGMLHELGHSLL